MTLFPSQVTLGDSGVGGGVATPARDTASTTLPLHLWCLPQTTSFQSTHWQRCGFTQDLVSSTHGLWLALGPHLTGTHAVLFSRARLSHVGLQLLPFQSVWNGIMAATCRKSSANQLFHLQDTLPSGFPGYLSVQLHHLNV